ncbi:MAG TPA: 2'-5' RNA ligase family protein [Candidatus Limnocylindrales bacterium]|nr:2'-5' RNA ligase family protein [Candidatus Limnocylindrales bacterium]
MESALIVAVPEAEPAVRDLRSKLDRAYAWGVPAHVTVLYPFVPPDQLTAAVLREVAATVVAQPRFRVTFERVSWFGEDVLWLQPSPDDPFRALTSVIWQRFPSCPPYGGAHDDVIPHLTVGHDHPLPILREAAATATARLPITARVGAVRLIAGTDEPGSWHTLCEFPLGQP